LGAVEEERGELRLRHLADRMGLPLFHWSRTRGLCRDGQARGVYETQEPAQALAHIVSSQLAALYVFAPFDGLATNELVIQRMKEAAESLRTRSGAIILTGPSLELHESLKRRVAVMQ